MYMIRSFLISCSIACYSFLETLRNRLFLGVILLSIPLSSAAWLLNTYELGFQVRLVTDAGITLISIAGLLVVLFFSLDMVVSDIEHRTIYFVITRSPDRHVYMLGRFLGIALTLLSLHLFLGGLLLAILKIRTGVWFSEVPVAVLMIYLKQLLLVSIVMMLAACSTRIVTVSLGILIYVVGHGLDIFSMLAYRQENKILTWILDIIAFVLPDFSVYETRVMVMHELPARGDALLLLCLYTFAAVFFYLSIGGAVLRRRDL
jgi:ABC-type transport system involved in multi-copper enzyme maturation permease subunit